jgi:putative phosphoesterase
VRIGLVSDTHGLLRPELFEQLAGVEHILHAGDLGPLDLLTELRAIAPVTIVWGNTDGMEVRAALPETARVHLGGVEVAVVHGHQFASPLPRLLAAANPGAGLVVFGHSHQPVVERVGDSLLVNPGSAGPRRFSQPVTLAIATIENGRVEATIVPLLGDGEA